jgi:hypothetical protein
VFLDESSGKYQIIQRFGISTFPTKVFSSVSHPIVSNNPISSSPASHPKRLNKNKMNKIARFSGILVKHSVHW